MNTQYKQKEIVTSEQKKSGSVKGQSICIQLKLICYQCKTHCYRMIYVSLMIITMENPIADKENGFKAYHYRK